MPESSEPNAPESIAPAPADTQTALRPTGLVDPAMEPAIAGDDGWMYSQSAEADLDSDGEAERVVITARAEMIRGQPLWDDGQPWQVYVQEPGGQRTYLFARYVQLGRVTMRIGRGEAEGKPSVVLVEHVPHELAVYEFEYDGPGRVEGVQRFQRSLDPGGEVSTPLP